MFGWFRRKKQNPLRVATSVGMPRYRNSDYDYDSYSPQPFILSGDSYNTSVDTGSSSCDSGSSSSDCSSSCDSGSSGGGDC